MNDIIEPEEENINEKKELNKILDNHIKNIVLLFNLQSKFNNEINQKLETSKVNSDNKLIVKLLDKTLNNHILLINLSNKIDNHIFYNTLFFSIGVITFGVICLHKRLI